jgi:L,D-transpeptidase ErfK/SrfK
MIKISLKISIVVIFLFLLKFYNLKDDTLVLSSNLNNNKVILQYKTIEGVKVKHDVFVENYFEYLDSIVRKYDSLTPYNLTEHLLVRANPWIIDTLQNTDYYRMKARDSFVYDQKKMIVLPKDASIIIPDSKVAQKILNAFENTILDVNIPEFKLRIYEDSILLYEFPVRVGRDEEKYLKMSGRVQDLKTKTGSGFIVNHVRNPRYVNPVNNHEYFVTKRDDKKVTKLPQIPFIETEINSLRHGQLIHPTTNPITLGKAYSNGCIGTKEADAWVIYYHAPIRTKIRIRYNLNVLNSNDEEIVLQDIYNKRKD